jgi:hypothetical protein
VSRARFVTGRRWLRLFDDERVFANFGDGRVRHVTCGHVIRTANELNRGWAPIFAFADGRRMGFIDRNAGVFGKMFFLDASFRVL